MTLEKKHSKSSDTSLTRNEALTLFSDHLEEIRNASVDNLSHSLESIRPGGSWVHQEVEKCRAHTIAAPFRRLIAAVDRRLMGRTSKKCASITDAMIERAKEHPIQDLYEESLQKSGERYSGLCPFHDENTASFFIFPENRFHCFGCGVHGDAIDYYQKLHGASFVTAVRALC